MRAIQTFYKGFHFRSRLEARWAVFFDSIGAEWVYEKEGFELSDGRRYLPDFWLPGCEAWLEVKGEAPDSDEIDKIQTFVREEHTGLVLAVGLPGDGTATWIGSRYEFSGSIPCKSTRFDDIRAGMDILPYKSGAVLFNSQQEFIINSSFLLEVSDASMKSLLHKIRKTKWKQASNAAKSARFEFGETPR